MWSVSEYIAEKKVTGKVSEKYRQKNVDGDEDFLTTIWLTGKLWEMEKVAGMKHDHWTDSWN